MKILKNFFTLTTIFATLLAPYHILASSESTPILTDDPSATASTNVRPIPPLKCDLFFFRGYQSYIPIDLSVFQKEKPTLPAQQIDETIDTILNKRESKSSFTFSILSDPNIEASTKYFTRLFHLPPDIKQPTDSYRKSILLTTFNPIQILIYKTLNSDVPFNIHITDDSAPKKHMPLRRGKSSGSLINPKSMVEITPEQGRRPMTFREQLLTFLELIKRLHEENRDLFDEKTTAKLLKKFDVTSSRVTNFQTLLVAADSRIPDHSSGHIKPGDLVIMIELSINPEVDGRIQQLLIIRNNVPAL